VRLKSEGAPNSTDGAVTESDLLCHPPRAPPRAALGLRLESTNDDVLDLVVGNGALHAGSRLIVQPIEPKPDEALAPLANRRSAAT
jgi:hypothetical protein